MPSLEVCCCWYTCAGSRSIEEFETDDNLVFDEDAFVPAEHVSVWLEDDLYFELTGNKSPMTYSTPPQHILCTSDGLQVTPNVTLMYSVKHVGESVCDSLYYTEPHPHKELRFLKLKTSSGFRHSSEA